MEYVWYASYGSNMYKERFLCYIKGEKYIGKDYREQGCRDKSLPIDEQNYRMNHELYFAFSVPMWQNMGVSFISRKKSKRPNTFSKMYKITKEQFEDVVKQENGIKVSDSLNIDYEQLKIKGEVLLFENSFYGTLMHIDTIDDVPVYTFTLTEEPKAFNRPSKEYLTSIVRGIFLNFGPVKEEVFSVFKDMKGIRGHLFEAELQGLIDEIYDSIYDSM